MKPIFDPIYGELLTSHDFLSSRTTVAGATLTFTSNGTDNFLQHTNGRLIFNDTASGAPSFYIYSAASGTPGVSVRGRLGIGLGTSLSGSPVPPGSNSSLVRISEDTSDSGWTTGIYMDPFIDSNIQGANQLIANYASLFNSGFDSHDADSDTPREHWDEDNDGAVYTNSYGITGTAAIAQSFLIGALPSNGDKEKHAGAGFRVYRSGNPGTLTIRVYAVDGSQKPTGSALATGTLDVSTVTTLSSGEWVRTTVAYSYIGTGLSESTRYALVCTVSGAGTLFFLSDDVSGAYTDGIGFTSADQVTWTELAGGTGDFLFDHYAYQGLAFTLTGHQVQLSASITGGPLLGWATRFSAFYVNTNMSVPSGSPVWTSVSGFEINALSVSGMTPTRSYALKINATGGGTSAWGINTTGQVQLTTITKLIFGGTATVLGVNYMARGATNDISMGLGALTNVHYNWSTTSFTPQGTIRTQFLGDVTTKGWAGVYLQDTAASFTVLLQTTNTSISANRVLVFDTNNVAGNISVSGSTFLMGTGSASAPTYSFSVDSNTGMYRDSADVIGMAVGGNRRLSIAATGFFAQTAPAVSGGTLLLMQQTQAAATGGDFIDLKFSPVLTVSSGTNNYNATFFDLSSFSGSWNDVIGFNVDFSGSLGYNATRAILYRANLDNLVGNTYTTAVGYLTEWGDNAGNGGTSTNLYGFWMRDNGDGGSGWVITNGYGIRIDKPVLNFTNWLSAYLDGSMQLTAGSNLILATSTGTKIGTSTSQLLGFWNATPVARPSAYTQTYSTADKTQANLTSATLTDNSGGTANTTVQALTNPTDTPVTADALRDDLVANLIPELRNNFADLTAQVNALRVDLEDVKQFTNSIVDDLQQVGMVG